MRTKKTRKTKLVPAGEIRLGQLICFGKYMFAVTEFTHYKHDKHIQCAICCDKYKFETGFDWLIPVFDGWEEASEDDK